MPPAYLRSLRFFLSRLSSSRPLRFDDEPETYFWPLAMRSKMRRASQSGNALTFL